VRTCWDNMTSNLHERKIKLLRTNYMSASLTITFGRILPGLNSLRDDLYMQSGQGAAMHADLHLVTQALYGPFPAFSGLGARGRRPRAFPPDATTLGDIYCQIEPPSGRCRSTSSRPRTGAAAG